LTVFLPLEPVLHPRHKLAYFAKAGWTADWIDTARNIIRAEYNRSYATVITGSDTGDASDVEAMPASCQVLIRPIISNIISDSRRSTPNRTYDPFTQETTKSNHPHSELTRLNTYPHQTTRTTLIRHNLNHLHRTIATDASDPMNLKYHPPRNPCPLEVFCNSDPPPTCRALIRSPLSDLATIIRDDARTLTTLCNYLLSLLYFPLVSPLFVFRTFYTPHGHSYIRQSLTLMYFSLQID
jgi:hypothetical protein